MSHFKETDFLVWRGDSQSVHQSGLSSALISQLRTQMPSSFPELVQLCGCVPHFGVGNGAFSRSGDTCFLHRIVATPKLESGIIRLLLSKDNSTRMGAMPIFGVPWLHIRSVPPSNNNNKNNPKPPKCCKPCFRSPPKCIPGISGWGARGWRCPPAARSRGGESWIGRRSP